MYAALHGISDNYARLGPCRLPWFFI